MSDFVERLIVQSNENNQLDIELDEDTRKDLSSELDNLLEFIYIGI